MIDKLYNYLTDDGSGFIFNTMLLELILVIISLLATQKLIIPLYRSYKQTKSLEEVATNQKPHWFYGHTRYVSTCAIFFSAILTRVQLQCSLISTTCLIVSYFSRWLT